MKLRPLHIWLGLAVVAGSVSGCATWHLPRLDLNRYRDPRAVDIDDRMGSTPSASAKTSRDEDH